MLATSVSDRSLDGSPTQPLGMARCDHVGLTASGIDATLELAEATIAGGNDDT